MLRGFVLAVLLLVQACAGTADPPPPPAYTDVGLKAIRWRAVLVAGDGSITAFDHAADKMGALLSGHAVPNGIARLSARAEVVDRPSVRSATLPLVVDAIAKLKPGDGEGCFVFVTSHGAPRAGLVLSVLDQRLSAEVLDRALVEGCGNAPTVVIASGCFTGNFAQPPMARANRVVLTAARADRTSFGCAADVTYTVFDQCLLTALEHGDKWDAVAALTRACVSAEESRRRFRPASEPQTYIGPAVAALPAFSHG